MPSIAKIKQFKIFRPITRARQRVSRWWNKNLWHKIVAILLTFLVVWVGCLYGVAQWYVHKYDNQPLIYGATFIPNYSRYLGVDPEDTFDAMIGDLGLKHLRLVSYWKDIEPRPGQYNFEELDWQFAKAEKAGVQVSLAIGLRQPRWPECHEPYWADKLPQQQFYTAINTFIAQVINRYQHSPVLASYQLENEYFNKVFGTCTNFDRQRLIDEYNLVKRLDPNRKIIISRSNNAIGIPVGQPQPDEFAVSVYKRVWDKNVTKRYFEYPFPAAFYAMLAGLQKIFLGGRNMIVHELQAEPWLAENFDIRTSPMSEVEKSLTPERLRDRFDYGKATGMREIYLWGAEWWYMMKVNRNEPGYWNVVKEELAKNLAENAKLLKN
ncbi:MAG TPA: beta-galactosidase [Candidatus Saccharimonadales bacterium]|nr:beta-galactosidase [Candidatus Saccharimonadales bacterium]